MKPTPTQAYVLRELLVVGGGNVLGLVAKRGEPTKIESCYRNTLQTKPTIVTLKILFTNGWIEPVDYHSWNTYGSSAFQISIDGAVALESMTNEDYEEHQNSLPMFTAQEIKDALSSKYTRYNAANNFPATKWVFFDEVADDPNARHSIIDFYVLNCWRSGNFASIAFEIKVYRNDFLKELKEPEKRAFGLSVSNEFYFVTPPGLAKLEENPLQ